MKNGKIDNNKLVLAIHPNTRGFGFALFQGSQKPLDWGVKEVREKNKKYKNIGCREKINDLINLYQPDVLVVEDYKGEGSRRHLRIQELIEDIHKLAKREKVAICSYSRGKICEVFSQFGAQTKYEIAKKIAEWLPVFETRMPPVRKAWMSEDYRMAIFDAVSLALTYFFIDS